MKKTKVFLAVTVMAVLIMGCGKNDAVGNGHNNGSTTVENNNANGSAGNENESEIQSGNQSGTGGDNSLGDGNGLGNSQSPEEPKVSAEDLADCFENVDCPFEADSEFFEWCAETDGDGGALLEKIYREVSTNGYSAEKWYELTGMTEKVTDDLYSGRAYEDNNIYIMNSNGEDGIQLTFGGDISFADNWAVMDYCKSAENGIKDCIDGFLIDKMKKADISMLNNEFCFSNGGKPLEGKTWTFRGNPSNVGLYDELGTDIVDLANNHVYDYGEQAFLDTLETLKNAEIEYMGAGKNIEEASRPVYYIIEGKKIAYVAATRAEKNILTPEAGESSPGVLRCYDPEAFIEVIKEAKKNADIVIANLHWGAEYSHELEDVQPETAYRYIDAGADLIVGTHAHCLQGIEFYKGVPIVYNLGNFWFNKKDIDTGLLGVTVNDDNSMELVFYPAVQSGCRTAYVGGEEAGERILESLRGYSINADFDKEGRITERK